MHQVEEYQNKYPPRLSFFVEKERKYLSASPRIYG
jgi:hypothetical protein